MAAYVVEHSFVFFFISVLVGLVGLVGLILSTRIDSWQIRRVVRLFMLFLLFPAYFSPHPPLLMTAWMLVPSYFYFEAPGGAALVLGVWCVLVILALTIKKPVED